MGGEDISWRLLPFIAILLVGVALLFTGCADPNNDTRQFYERLDRQSGGSSL